MFNVSRLKDAARSGLEKLFPTGPLSSPIVKTPGIQSSPNAALSHVVKTLTAGAAHPSPSVKTQAKTPPGTVFVPASATASAKGDARVAQRGVVLAAVNTYYQDKGYSFSRAAIEEAAGHVELDVKTLELTYLRDAQGNRARDLNGKPIMGYYVTLTPDGATTAKNAELTREADNALDAFIPEAKRITELGTASVTDKTQLQRFEMLRQAYARRYGPDAAERLTQAFTSMENMGLLIGGAAVMTTPLAPAVMAVGGYGMAKETIELAGLSDDIGRGLSQAERPSDIEKLTPKLDELVQRTSLLTVNMAASGGLSKGANLAKTGVTTGLPSAPAVVTPEGMTFPAPSQLPVKPTGGGSPLPAIGDVAPTGLPNVKHPPGLTPAENVGGPAGRPQPIFSGRVDVEPGRTLTPAEQSVAELLASEGRQVTAKREINAQSVKNPDFIVDGVNTELKTVSDITSSDISGALSRRIQEASKQASHIIIDARQQAGLSRELAERSAVRAYKAQESFGTVRIEQVRIIGRDFDITVPYTPSR
jgi:hypothetical protein